MPAFVLPFRCDGCGACVLACPSSIIHIDSSNRKAFNIEPEMCWECYPCVKACPQKAIEIRGYSDFVPLGAKVLPKRDTAANTITWTIDFRNGKVLKFTFPLRTTLWGSIKAPQDLPSGDIKSQSLALEDQFLGVAKLPTPKQSS